MKRAFLVEDEGVVALLIESMLDELGYEVIGPVPRLAKALDVARTENFEIAVLDVNLNGTTSFPIADLLLEKGIPFVFATGYGAPGIPPVSRQPRHSAKAIQDTATRYRDR